MSVEPGTRTPDAQSITSDREARKQLTEAELWIKKIELQRENENDWRKEAHEAEQVYEADEDAVSFNIFHSNVETLLPALYNSTPVPDVRRRFGDPDPVAKMVVDISERAVSFSLDQFDFDTEVKAVIKDGEVTGRGCGKFRYKPSWNDTKDKLIKQACQFERVPWNYVVIGPSKSYAKLPWIAEEQRLIQDELVELASRPGGCGKKAALEIPLDCDETDGNAEPDRKRDSSRETGITKAARVYQVWDRRKGKVLWIAEGYKDKPLLKIDDPLGLPDFYPYDFYNPLQRLSSTCPIVPFKVYRALIDELDNITARIRKLIKTLRVRGLVSAELKDELLKIEALEDGQYAQAGGGQQFLKTGAKLEDLIAHMPMEPQVKALQQLYVQREQLKQTIYEVTGISDILRGASDASETLGAQQIKTQWGSLRIQNRQEMVTKLPRKHFRDCVTVVGTAYKPDQISLMTSLPMNKQDPNEVALFQQALAVMSSPEMAAYKVDIETNSTIKADMARVQEQLTQFMMMTGQFMKGLEGFAMQMPMAIPLFLEVYTAVARNFKLGKQAEDALDRSAQQLPQMLQQMMQQGQQEDPEVKQKRELHQLDMQAGQMKHQQELQLNEQKVQHAERLHQLEMEMAQVKAEQAELDAVLQAEGAERELQHKERGNVIDLASKRASTGQELQHKEQAHGQASRHAEGSAAQKARHADADASQKRKHADGEAVQEARHAEGEALQAARHKEGEARQEARHADTEASQKVAHQGAQAAIKTASAAASADIKERGQQADEAHADRVRAAEAKAVGAGGNKNSAGADKAGAAKKKRQKNIKLKKNADGDIVGAIITDSEGDEVELMIA